MESILLTIHPQDPVWMMIAFMCGLVATWLKQPPLVGFLAAGFLLNAFGVEISEFLRITADLGITLLLFNLGLKLKIRSLLKPEVWGVASVHLLVTTILIGIFVFALTRTITTSNGSLDIPTALLIGFALTFSSTVFAVKILDAMGGASTQHGKLSIGILIMQDIAAVAFVAASAGKLPNPWALTLFAIIPLRHLFHKILDRSGHGELLILLGITLAIGGADLFEIFDMKGDLGALLVGMLFSGHPKSNELAKGLLGFKNLFLVGFFLTVGMTAMPGMQELVIAACLLLLLPIKTGFYFLLFWRAKLETRTSWQSSLNLANFSEFGLIVGSIAMTKGWLPPSWLAVFAILIAISFMVSAPLATQGDDLYVRFADYLKPFERSVQVTPKDKMVTADFVVIGMGRVGTSIFDRLSGEIPGSAIGVDADDSKVRKHLDQNRNVLIGDGTNPDFWSKAPSLFSRAKWIILALPSHQANCYAAERLQEKKFQGRIAATTRYPDEAEALKELGVEWAFNIHAEAGRGFAADFLSRIPTSGPSISSHSA